MCVLEEILMRSFRSARLHLAIVLGILATIFAAPTAIKAQDSSSMTGVVTDATGAVVPGTTVTLTNKSTGVSYTQVTNRQGSYTFGNVAPHEGYTVTFAHPGFAPLTVESLALSVGQTRTLDEKLNAGATQAVVVSASSQVSLDTTDAQIGNNINPSELNSLPIYDRTNGITTLFFQQPGVDSNQGAVAGARIDQSEVTLDGLDVNDIAAGTTFGINGNAPVDSISQFTGTVTGLVPGVGTGSGGQFQLVTKSGTNQFHGNINEYHRDTTTVANTWFNNLVGLPRTPLIHNQFGGNLGGPIVRNKLFFFFDIADSRIVQSASGNDTVPLTNITATGGAETLNYINSGPNCSDSSRINTQPTCISSLTATQVASLDPLHVGFSQNMLTFIDGRYPAPNDLTEGDGVNTGGYRFTYPTPDNDITYVGRIDYNLSSHHKIFGRFTINRRNSTESLPVFPSDPPTHPRIDRTYGYVVSDVWTIGTNKVNQFYYGDNISKLSFPNAYNPTGANQYSFTGGLSGPYSGNDGQKRRVPIPVVRDDFNWQLGNHSLVAGGTFKFIKTNSNLINDFNFPTIGEAGALGTGLDPTLRPADIFTDPNATAINDYDAVFPMVLGVVGSISTNYNYNSALAAVPAGTGGPRAYRFYQTEAYVGDTWKVNNKLTFTYGLRYQFYSVPYETKGEESIEYEKTSTGTISHQDATLDNYVKARLAQSAAGNTSNSGLPLYQVELGGKANNAPGLYAPSYKDIAPRFAFAYNAFPGMVINGSAAVVYDRTVINAIDFLQDQLSYLFSNTQVSNFGGATPEASLSTDTRVGSGLSYPASLNPAPAPLTLPYTPYVDSTGTPYGLAAGNTNFVISPNLKDPYSLAFNIGVQQQLPGNMFLKVSYVNRLGRRLLADADAGQVLDVPDYTGGSTQTMAQAFAGLTTQLRAGGTVGTLTPEPWFENVLGPGIGAASGLGNNTNLVAAIVGPLGARGDISDMLYYLAYYTYYQGFTGLLPTNIGIPSQFGANAYLDNKGNSSYNAMLVTLTKNTSHGLRFNVNYTWSHSIDNTSLSANGNALFVNLGFICDITKPRACRGSSDFDVTQEMNSNFTYDLPFGRGKPFLGSISPWANEAIGGWSLSGLPSYRTGLAVTPYSDAYLASFDNLDPAIFTGNKGDLKSKINVSNSTVYNFAGGEAGANKVLAEFRGPIGLEYGNRNLLRGPGAFFLDAGLAKTFPIFRSMNLIFRADAYNILNHPVFGTPNVNIVNNASIFGQITSTAHEPGAASAAAAALPTSRVAQFSLRLEF
jgi:hypothetical protein